MTVRVHVTCDTSEVDHDLDRILRGPSMACHKAFAGALAAQFQETQARVHVVTGSLKASGDHDVVQGSPHDWEGFIRYGPATERVPVPGPARNAAEYAIFEQEKSDFHNYMFELEEGFGRELYVDAIRSWMRGVL